MDPAQPDQKQPLQPASQDSTNKKIEPPPYNPAYFQNSSVGTFPQQANNMFSHGNLLNRPIRTGETVQPGHELSILDQEELKETLLQLGRLLLLMQIYKLEHPIVQERLSKLILNIIKIANNSGRLILSSREDLIFLNGYQEKVSGGPLQKLVDTLKFLKVASFEIDKGITQPELTSFFKLIAAQKRMRIAGDIKEQLQKESITHVRPIFLQYVEVDDLPKDVPKPKNVIEGTKHGFKKGSLEEEQLVVDFLKGKISELPKKINTFLLNHPKLAAMIIVKLMDEYETQKLDSFSAFQAYIQSLSHYMARLSRLMNNPDKAAQALEKLEKHLILRLKSLKKDRKFIVEVKEQVKDALLWVAIEQLVFYYQKAKENLESKEQEIIEAFEKRKTPSARQLKERLSEIGLFQTKLGSYVNSKG